VVECGQEEINYSQSVNQDGTRSVPFLNIWYHNLDVIEMKTPNGFMNNIFRISFFSKPLTIVC